MVFSLFDQQNCLCVIHFSFILRSPLKYCTFENHLIDLILVVHIASRQIIYEVYQNNATYTCQQISSAKLALMCLMPWCQRHALVCSYKKRARLPQSHYMVVIFSITRDTTVIGLPFFLSKVVERYNYNITSSITSKCRFFKILTRNGAFTW